MLYVCVFVVALSYNSNVSGNACNNTAIVYGAHRTQPIIEMINKMG